MLDDVHYSLSKLSHWLRQILIPRLNHVSTIFSKQFLSGNSFITNVYDFPSDSGAKPAPMLAPKSS